MSASDEDIRLLSIAGSISEGKPVDWTDIDRHDDPAFSAIVSELKVLEELARIHEDTPKAWGPFTIVSEIARGAFGTVYMANDASLGLTVALKVIRARSPETPFDAAKALNEARLLAKISHPNVVRVFRADRIGDEVGVAMEFVKGRTLEDLVQQSRFNAREATLIGIDLCHALAAVHRSGALHGDIKAHNVMRGEGGRTVLMDFGAGKALASGARNAGPDFVGTPLYMAPEVFAGQPRSRVTDIYSLGVLLYYLVSRAYPVEGSTRTEVERVHQRPGRRIPLRDVQPDLPDSFVRVVERAVAERPDDRYQSAGELEAALSATLMPEPRSWWKEIAAAAVVLLTLGVAGLMWRSPDRPGGAASAESATANAAALTAPAADSYRIKAVLNRDHDGVEVPLTPGARLAPSERLSMALHLSAPTHVYVVNEDERGNSTLLFPLPGREPSNPLPAGQHRLPGMLADDKLYWQVTSAGGREHFVVIASPMRWPPFERMFASLPSPVLNQPISYPRLSGDALGVLRSVGGLAVTPASGREQLRTTPGFAIPLSDKEEIAQGVWIRQATFDNPD